MFTTKWIEEVERSADARAENERHAALTWMSKSGDVTMNDEVGVNNALATGSNQFRIYYAANLLVLN